MSASRRKFLRTLASATSALAISEDPVYAQRTTSALEGTEAATQSSPQSSGIEHIVVVTMENRSFDHFLGWVPGADGKQAGLSFTDSKGAVHSTHALAPDYTGCGHPDPDHSYGQSRVAYDNGAMDGFLHAGSNDAYAIGYYTQTDLPFYSALARNYLVCDRYFASILGPTFPNRMFLWAGQTDRLGDTVALSSLPTIFDRLAAARVSHRYYFNNLPYLAFWGFKYLLATGTFSEFLAEAARGTLPAVSFVDPNFTLLDDGTGNDDHPHADIRNGDAFLARIFHALASSAAWKNTVLIINFDEWGGFFDHVPPPRAIAPNNIDTDLLNGQALLGFRVPVIVASPFTRNTGPSPLINHTVFDHTSVLKLIEWRWGLQPLTARDASSQIGNFADSMNFAAPDASLPAIPLPPAVSAAPCFGGTILDSASAANTERSPATEAHSPWAALAQTEVVRKWIEHSRFREK
jgi:phospholipase C